MALLKPYETPHGVVATYHKIVKAEIDTTSQSVSLTVAIYASPEARDAGKGALWHEYPVVPFAALSQDPRGLLYPLLAAYDHSYLHGAASDSPDSYASFEIRLKPVEDLAPPDRSE